MAKITIRNLDDEIHKRPCARAAVNSRTMEEEVRQILRKAVGRAPRSRNLASIIRSHFGPLNGVDLALPRRNVRDSEGSGTDFLDPSTGT